ncbi:ATP-binding protein [Streptomyces lydicus]|uniref:ATP-binding protein n=1 Tax=Streptomyces lydicus TaxID=47763 RepID=UPI0037AFBC76
MITDSLHYSSVESPVDACLEEITPPAHQSDTALAADHGVIRHVRHNLVGMLQSSGPRHVADEFTLSAQELMANGVLHGRRRIHDGTLTISVSCSGQQQTRLNIQDPSNEQPLVRDALDDEISGRGMLIVQAFTNHQRLDAPTNGAGKSAWMEISGTPSSREEAA